MVWPLVEIGGVFSVFCLLVFCLIELPALYRRDSSSAIITLIIAVAIAAVFGHGWPHWSPYYLIGYLVGGTLWMPFFWYVTLRRNHRGLRTAEDRFARRNYGVEQDGRWLPNHPAPGDVAANGLLWFFALPIYLGESWIRWVVDNVRSTMERIRGSLAVEIPSES